MKAAACTSFSVQKLAVCKSFSVSNLLCGKRRACLLWRRDPFLEQVLGQRQSEIESALRRADELTRAEIS